MQYLVVIEKTATGFSAYSPDLPGCVSTGSTREEIDKNIREAIEFHLEGLRQRGMNCHHQVLTQPTSTFLPNISRRQRGRDCGLWGPSASCYRAGRDSMPGVSQRTRALVTPLVPFHLEPLRQGFRAPN